MTNPSAVISGRRSLETPIRSDEHSCGVSWGAVIGGAFVAAATALIMLALGAGFGLSAVSPWSNIGASAAALGAGAIVWMIFTQVVSYSLGGYLTGRLRTKWMAVHTDEVYFRDTANGFLAWAVAVVMTVTFLVSSASSMVGNASTLEPVSDPHGYFVDRMFRSQTAQPIDVPLQTEASRILANALRETGASPADQTYLARLVAVKTGLSEAEAEQRVTQVTADARESADAARRAAAKLLLWLFVALLAGAFCASYAATIGGRQRDHVKAI
jgi:hypothetical protein